MSKAELGRKIPAFRVSCTNSQKISISALKGMNVVLYFYPKDNTPGCTQEGQDFRANYKKFKKQNTIIFGISRDSISSHEKFKLKQKFPFELISDDTEKLCKIFDVIKIKRKHLLSINEQNSVFPILVNCKHINDCDDGEWCYVV